jgi:O-acetyl-ADP-ribose deacetylase (regulator of RNase III)
VDVSLGDIFDIQADAIISPANSFGFMDGGIDLAYSEYFGRELQDTLQNIIREDFYGELPVGAAAIVATKHAKIKYLISCPTMRVPENVSNTVNAHLAFRAGLITAVNFNKSGNAEIAGILCPGLGTLTGNLSPENCARQMRYAYDAVINGKVIFPKDLYTAHKRHKFLKGDLPD